MEALDSSSSLGRSGLVLPSLPVLRAPSLWRRLQLAPHQVRVGRQFLPQLLLLLELVFEPLDVHPLLVKLITHLATLLQLRLFRLHLLPFDFLHASRLQVAGGALRLGTRPVVAKVLRKLITTQPTNL